MPSLPDRLQALDAALASGDRHAARAASAALAAHLRSEDVDDPLLAASLLEVVEDPALRAALAPVAAAAPSQAARARVMVVGADGQGAIIEVIVALVPGRTGVWTPNRVARDADVAAQLAAAAVLGPARTRTSVRWQVNRLDADLSGASIGLGVAAAVAAAARGAAVPTDVAFTGGVDLDGRIAEIASLPAKLRAAQAAGCARAFIPAAQLATTRAPPGVEVVGVPTVQALLERLFPETAPEVARRPLPRWPALLIAPVLAFTGAPDAVDAALYTATAAALRPPIPSDNTAVMEIPANTADLRALRAQHPAVLRGLADAGATAVAFDLLFTATDPADEAFAAAIREVEARGTAVIVGARVVDDAWSGPGSPAVRDAARRGVIEVEPDLLFGTVRRFPARRRLLDEAPAWHLAVEALRAHLRAGPPAVHDGSLHVGVTRNPLDADRAWLTPVQPAPHLRYDDPTTWGLARGRVVVVGVAGGARDWLRTLDGPRYGAELHAGAIETLARQAASRRLPAAADAAAAAAVGVGTWVIRQRVPRRLGALAAVPVATATLVWAVAVWAGVVGSLTALWLAAWVAVRWSDRRG